MDLQDLRQSLDEIDRQLLTLFLQRMEISGEIARYKQEHGLAVLQPARETEILDWAKKTSEVQYAAFSERFFRDILALSREYQSRILQGSEKSQAAGS